MSFQIGPDHYGYVYEMTRMQVDGKPVYKCQRGRDNDPGHLFLYYDAELRIWQALQMRNDPTSSVELVQWGTPAFKSVDPGDDIRVPGKHNWQAYDATTHRWWEASAFRTTGR